MGNLLEKQSQIDRVRSEFAALLSIGTDSIIIEAMPHIAMVRAIVFVSQRHYSCRQLSNKYGVSIKAAANIIKEKTSKLS